MRGNYTLINNRNILFSKFIRFCVLFGAIYYVLSILFSIAMLLFKEHYFSIEQRTLITTLLLVPLLISLAIIVLYEQLYPKRQFTWLLVLKLVAFQLYLALPVIIFSLRYDDIPAILAFIVSTIGLITLFFSLLFEFKALKIFKDIIYIYYHSWHPKNVKIYTSHFDEKKMREERKFKYTELETLRVFQDHFVKDSAEISHIISQLNNTDFFRLHKNAPLKILDIGGFNGEFTRRLIEALGLNVHSIDVIEPVAEVAEEYKSNLSPFTNQITNYCEKFENYNPKNIIEYDFIIASHSLYSSIDNTEYSYDDVVNKMLSLLKKNGILLIILGSPSGKAYALKSELIKLLLNEENHDSNSVGLKQGIERLRGIYFTILSVDNCIILNGLINDDEKLKKWVSYFARVPICNDKYTLDQIRDMFLIYSIKFQELPECSKTYYSKYNIKPNVEMLLHKTDVILISRNIANIKKKNSV